MEPRRFDTLVRAMLTCPSRRTLVASVSTSLLLPAALSLQEETTAKKKRKKRKKKKPVPTCSDGKRNGNETDIDCGGPTCPQCGNGRTCAKNTDCSTSLCGDGRGQGGVCASCTNDGVCGSDANGQCLCNEPTGLCISDVQPQLVATCNLCPQGTVCIEFFEGPGCMTLCAG